jgi:hypothetical protein
MEENVPRLTCPGCGLSYASATLPQYLLSATGAACPRCSTPLARAAAERQDSARRPRLGSNDERHRAALQRTIRWAEEAAASGDYPTAFAWLATIEAVEGELPKELEAKRRAWAGVSAAAASEG